MKRILSIIIFSLILFHSHAQQEFTLEECRQFGLKNNNELKIAREKVSIGQNLVKAARTEYLPNFTANGAYLRNEKNVSLLAEDALLPVGTKMTDGSFGFTPSQVNNGWTMVNGNPVPLDANGQAFNPKTNPEKILWKQYAYLPKESLEMDMHNIFTGGISMTQPVFLGGKIRELNRIAKSSKKIAEAQLNGTTSETIVEIDAAYWRVISLINKKKLAESYVDLLQKMDSDLQKSIAFGVATKSDGLSVKVKLNEAEMLLMQVENGLTLSKMSLCELCGLALNTEFTLADENLQFTENTTTPVIDIVSSVENRYEIICLKQAVNIAESNRRIMLSRFMPNVFLTGGYVVSNPNMYNGYANEFAGMWQVGVVVNVPIFHWGERLYTLNKARSEQNIAQYKLEEAKEKIELDITQATFKINEATKKAQMTKYNKEKAEENLRYAIIGFESGVISPSVLMEAQTAWLKSKSEAIDALIEVKLCDVYLKKALETLK